MPSATISLSPPVLPSSRASLPPASRLSLSSAAAFVGLHCPIAAQPRCSLPCRNSRPPLPSLTVGCCLPTPIIDSAVVLLLCLLPTTCRRYPLLQSPLLPAAFPPTTATVIIFLSSFPAAAATRRRCPLPWPPLPPSAASVPLFPLLLSSLFQPLSSSLAATITPLYSACTLHPLSLQPPQSLPRLCPPLPPRSSLFLPFAPHDTTASSLVAAALAAIAAFKCAPALLSSSIATVSHSSPPIATSVATLTARQPLVVSSRSNSIYSNCCPSLTM
ncbi:hypothetical protein B296_00031356 [Ensete ventricosum]|uniref:Uncharacterized protein n=1 Tax=Ensete ventricosum TaxID=4639 RepID=A0A426XBD7_ENSVE|nr:hypothetical protein B296_00031356 [Ensete ventricosum]